MHASAILMMLTRYSSCLMMYFKWCQVNLLEPGADESLHLLIAYLNSSLEKGYHREVALHLILLRMLRSTWQLRAVLNVLWRASHRLSGKRHRWPLCLMASVAESLHLLIQSISSQGLWLLFATSWILSLKKDLLTFLTTFLKLFQLLRLLVIL